MELVQRFRALSPRRIHRFLVAHRFERKPLQAVRGLVDGELADDPLCFAENFRASLGLRREQPNSDRIAPLQVERDRHSQRADHLPATGGPTRRGWIGPAQLRDKISCIPGPSTCTNVQYLVTFTSDRLAGGSPTFQATVNSATGFPWASSDARNEAICGRSNSAMLGIRVRAVGKARSITAAYG